MHGQQNIKKITIFQFYKTPCFNVWKLQFLVYAEAHSGFRCINTPAVGNIYLYRYVVWIYLSLSTYFVIPYRRISYTQIFVNVLKLVGLLCLLDSSKIYVYTVHCDTTITTKTK